MKSRSGFTIVEVVIAVSIIAILTTIGVYSFLAVQKQTRDSERGAKATLIAESLEKYYEKNGEYPSPRALTNNYSDNRTATIASSLSLDTQTIVAPRAPAGTVNSLSPAAATGDSFMYEASSSTNDLDCQNNRNGGCDTFTLSYLREEDEETVSIQSRQTGGEFGRPAAAPTARTVTAAQSGANVTATSTVLTCAAGHSAKYSFRSRINSDAWSAWGIWQTKQNLSRGSNIDSVTYSFQVQVRCDSSSAEGDVSLPSNIASVTFYSPLVAPTTPTASIAQSGSSIIRTSTAVSCTYGTPEYRIDSSVNGSGWAAGTWGTGRSTSEGPVEQGSWYAARVAARCARGTTYATSGNSSQVTYTHPINAPGTPSVSHSVNGNTSTFSASNVSCPDNTTIRYGYKYDADWGYDSGWYGPTTTNTVSWDTSSQGFRYNVSFRAQCYNSYATSGWGGTAVASYERPVTGANGLSWSISRGAANVVYLYGTSSCGPGAQLMYRSDIHSWDYRWGGSSGPYGWYGNYAGAWSNNDWSYGNPAFAGANGQTLNYASGSRWNMAVDLLCRNSTTGRQSANTGRLESHTMYMP